MRIPPAIATEIGGMYAAAHVNDTAARSMLSATMLIDLARTNVTSGNRLQAVEDARRALDILGTVAATADTRVAHGAREGARLAAAPLHAGLAAIFRASTTAALTHLSAASAEASTAATAARDEAAAQRYSAEQLAAEWM